MAAALALLAGVGCGSQTAHATGEATHGAAAAALPPAPSGTCDRDHEQAAVAIAARLLHGQLEGCAFGEPSATFAARFMQPQTAGQPAQAPVYGWTIQFPLESVDTSVADPSTPLLQRILAKDPDALQPDPAGAAMADALPPGTTGDANAGVDASVKAQPLAITDTLDPAKAPTQQEPGRAPRDLSLHAVQADPAHDDEQKPKPPVRPAPPIERHSAVQAPGRREPVVHLAKIGVTVDVFVAVDGTTTVL